MAKPEELAKLFWDFTTVLAGIFPHVYPNSPVSLLNDYRAPNAVAEDVFGTQFFALKARLVSRLSPL